MRYLLAMAACGLVAPGCGTMNTARALAQGEHAVGVTLGGPIITSPVPMPLPNVVVEGRIGLPEVAHRKNDVRFGTDLTGFGFGQIAIHGGWTWQLVEADRAVPAFAVTNFLFLDTNVADWTKEATAKAFWAVWGLEATVSWDVGPHLAYLGLAEYLDFLDPDLLLTPFVGFELDAKKARVQLELRWYAINQPDDRPDIHWLSPGFGAIGANIGVTIPIGAGGG